MNKQQQKTKGFTLLEILLVLAISSSLIVLMLNYTTQKSEEMRRDKTVLQMEQILNAALSYYVNNSLWPVTVVPAPNQCGTAASNSTVSTKLTPNYIPQQSNYNNPYGNPYTLNCAPLPAGAFYVYTQAETVADAQIIAGRLPMGFVTDANSATTQYPPTQLATCLSASPPATCNYVVAFVNIPGQNLNNARSVNFAGTFSPSACVPAPVCPSGMKASIMVVPAGVSGVNDAPNCTGNSAPYNPTNSNNNGTATTGNNCSANFYPVSSFTAYAVGGDAVGNPTTPGTPGTGGTGPYDCSITQHLVNKMPCLGSQGSDTFSATNGASAGSTLDASYKYWRVCLGVVTTKGIVVVGSGSHMAEWGKMTGSIVAFTRCVPNLGAETPIGSGYNVWQSNNGFSP